MITNMTSDLENIIYYINALACGLIAIRIFLWRTSVSIDSYTLRLITYLFIISFACVTIESLSANYIGFSISEALINTMLCIFCYASRSWVGVFKK